MYIPVKRVCTSMKLSSKVYTGIYQYVLCLHVAPAENMVGRVPLIPLFLAGNSTLMIPHKFSKRKPAARIPAESGFPFGCADAAGNVY